MHEFIVKKGEIKVRAHCFSLWMEMLSDVESINVCWTNTLLFYSLNLQTQSSAVVITWGKSPMNNLEFVMSNKWSWVQKIFWPHICTLQIPMIFVAIVSSHFNLPLPVHRRFNRKGVGPMLMSFSER